MGKIMHTQAGKEKIQSLVHYAGYKAINHFTPETGQLTFNEALEQDMIEVEEMDFCDGTPMVRITNNSSWRVVLFKGKEFVGRKHDCLLGITLTLQQNATAVIPACFLAETYFFDQGMISPCQYLHYFRANDNQAGLILKQNGKVIGERCGAFPLSVDVRYSRFSGTFASQRLALN